MPVRWDLQRDPFEAHTVVMAHSALMLLAEDVVQGAPDPRHLGCAFLSGRLLEFGVEGRAIDFLEIAIGRFQCGDAGCCQFLGGAFPKYVILI
jgi:hypothetical protein